MSIILKIFYLAFISNYGYQKNFFKCDCISFICLQNMRTKLTMIISSSDDQNNDSNDYWSDSSEDYNDVYQNNISEDLNIYGQICSLKQLDFDQKGNFGVPLNSKLQTMINIRFLETSFEFKMDDFNDTNFYLDDSWDEV